MPDNTTTTTSTEVSSGQGITFSIGGTKIDRLFSTPDIGAPPATIDVTSFDDTVSKRYIPGLLDTSNLTFEFFSIGTNFQAARNAEPENGQTATYTVTFPDSTVATITGSHRTYMSAMGQDEGLKFKVELVVSSISYSST